MKQKMTKPKARKNKNKTDRTLGEEKFFSIPGNKSDDLLLIQVREQKEENNQYIREFKSYLTKSGLLCACSVLLDSEDVLVENDNDDGMMIFEEEVFLDCQIIDEDSCELYLRKELCRDSEEYLRVQIRATPQRIRLEDASLQDQNMAVESFGELLKEIRKIIKSHVGKKRKWEPPSLGIEK